MHTMPTHRPTEPVQPSPSGEREHLYGYPVVIRTAAALLAVLMLASCSSSKKSTASASPSASAPTSATATASPSPTGTAPADVAAATTQVTQNWEKFFSPSTSLTDKAALLQNGDQLMPLLQGFAADPRVGQVQAKVTDVTFTSPTTATVTYSLSLQGQVVQPNASGQAVLDNGVWKVSKSTLCGLVQLSGNTGLPGCS